MRELEKILEEIEQRVNYAKNMPRLNMWIYAPDFVKRKASFAST